MEIQVAAVPCLSGSPPRHQRPVGKPRLDLGPDNHQPQNPAVEGEDGRAEQQQNEPALVVGPHAVVDEDAVVVHPPDALFADTAVF